MRKRPIIKKFAPSIDWEWMLVVGIFVGAFFRRSSQASSRRTGFPRMGRCLRRCAGLRWVVSLVGGILMGFGARWAGGCTSGHGISGTLQLAVSSWLAVMGFFAGGIVTAMFFFMSFELVRER